VQKLAVEKTRKIADWPFNNDVDENGNYKGIDLLI
jgi:hypothetical protein